MDLSKPEQRLEFVEELLRTTQVFRKNALTDGMGIADPDHKLTPEKAEEFLSGMFPWMFGPKSIMHALTKLALRKEPPTGSEVYNLLIIARQLDKTGAIKQAYEIYNRWRESLPEATPALALY